MVRLTAKGTLRAQTFRFPCERESIEVVNLSFICRCAVVVALRHPNTIDMYHSELSGSKVVFSCIVRRHARLHFYSVHTNRLSTSGSQSPDVLRLDSPLTQICQ